MLAKMQNGNLQNIDFKPFSKISRLFWFVYSDVRDLISKENQIMKKRGGDAQSTEKHPLPYIQEIQFPMFRNQKV